MDKRASVCVFLLVVVTTSWAKERERVRAEVVDVQTETQQQSSTTGKAKGSADCVVMGQLVTCDTQASLPRTQTWTEHVVYVNAVVKTNTCG